MFRNWQAICVFALLFFVSNVAFAEGDFSAGEAKASNCMGCHGVDGYYNAYPNYRVPRLGGQHAQYIVSALIAYQNGERKHPTMHAQAATLSAQDMDNLATYFQESKSATKSIKPRGDSAKGKELSGQCVACHTETGKSDNPSFPTIAGQYPDYLEEALNQYKSGKRNNAIMAGIVSNLSEKDMADLAAYFSQQEGVSNTSGGTFQ